MLRDVRLLPADRREDLADTALAIHEQLQDLEAGGLAERLEQVRLGVAIGSPDTFSLWYGHIVFSVTV
jgi:hypothetical protein